MSNELEPLDDDVRALLRAAKPIADLDPTVKAAILADVGSRVGLPPPPGGGGSGGGSGSGGGGGGAGLALTGSRAVAALAATFALGVVAGVGGASLRQAAPSSVTTVDAPRSSAPERAPPVTPSAPAEVTAVAVGSLPGVPDTVPAGKTAPLPPSAPVEPPALSARGLAAERGVLDVARSALARGEAADALVAVERHEHDYPQGVLVEEREAIAVKALVALGRGDEARSRAARFEERFPNGLMLRAVKGAVGDP